MKLYKTKKGITIEKENSFYELAGAEWEQFINDDDLAEKVGRHIAELTLSEPVDQNSILAPIGNNQELWACGVTYLRSKVGRQEESKASGGADFYGKVYDAVRPEVFFKANPYRIVGHKAKVRIRKDSTWDVPEPELTLVVSSSGKIVGVTIGNDMSSRSIEGENPLYLPQAKTYDACAALGPCILVLENALSTDTLIKMKIERNGITMYEDSVAISQMKRTLEELVSFVFYECSFPYGCLIMTGTGIVPGNDFTLQSDDVITISISGIGSLINVVE
jgi:2-dehydro-3-deoxy-D-arabinonate dehydratase